VVAICDLDEDAAAAAAERFGADTYTDHVEMYDEADLDAAFVCVPPFAHGAPEIDAAERGIDLFVEKPLALEMGTAAEIFGAITAEGVLAGVGYNWRYSQGVERAREIVSDRPIAYVDARWWGGVPGGEGHWWRDAERSGGQIVEQATHIYDAVRWIAGEVEEVSATGSNHVVDEVNFPGAAPATMEHDSGAVSNVSTTCAAAEEDAHIEIVAQDATLHVTQHELVGTVDGEPIEESYDRNPYREEVDAFLEAVVTRDRSSLRSDYRDALKSFALTLAATEAVEEEGPVEPTGVQA